MKQKIVTILSRILGVPAESIGDDASTLSHPEWDSLRHMNLVLAIEEECGVRFGDAEILELTSLPRILAALEREGCR